MKKLILLSALISSVALAEMQELGDEAMQNTTGQGGITISAKLDFGEGTRLSFKNDAAEYKDANSGPDWLILDNLTGSVEAKNLKTDYVDVLHGPNGDKDIGVIQMTLPDEVVFDKLRTDGLYVGPTEKVDRTSSNFNRDYRFVLGMEIDGTLQAPASTKVNTFAFGAN